MSAEESTVDQGPVPDNLVAAIVWHEVPVHP